MVRHHYGSWCLQSLVARSSSYVQQSSWQLHGIKGHWSRRVSIPRLRIGARRCEELVVLSRRGVPQGGPPATPPRSRIPAARHSGWPNDLPAWSTRHSDLTRPTPGLEHGSSQRSDPQDNGRDRTWAGSNMGLCCASVAFGAWRPPRPGLVVPADRVLLRELRPVPDTPDHTDPNVPKPSPTRGQGSPSGEDGTPDPSMAFDGCG